jgi:hypothetical protein
MLKEHLMLTLLIRGPKQPGNDIDVYLEPLIEELKELWDQGVDMYDSYSKSNFNLKAILMWTINDFPAYGNLAGCATKGKTACPICGEGTCSEYLPHSKKTVYMGHRRFLDSNHPFRQKGELFDGQEETRGRPKPLTNQEVLNAVNNIHNDWGKKKRKRNTKDVPMLKKRSKFFDLPYWGVCPCLSNFQISF